MKGQKKEAGELRNEKMKKKKKKKKTKMKKIVAELQKRLLIVQERFRRMEKAEPTTEAEEAAVGRAEPVDVTREHDGQEGEEKLTDDNAENHAGSSPWDLLNAENHTGIYAAIPDKEEAEEAEEAEVLESEEAEVGSMRRFLVKKNHAGIYVQVLESEEAEEAEVVEVLEADVDEPEVFPDNFDEPGEAKPCKRTCCKFWLRGSCQNGEDCSWWHEPGREGEKWYDHHTHVPCNYHFSKKGCAYGDSGLNLSRDIKG